MLDLDHAEREALRLAATIIAQHHVFSKPCRTEIIGLSRIIERHGIRLESSIPTLVIEWSKLTQSDARVYARKIGSGEALKGKDYTA